MIRAFAEWEEQELLMLSIPHKNTDWAPYLNEILDAYEVLVRTVADYQKVLLIAPEASDFERFSHIENVRFAQIPTNDTWIRDYGAIDFLNGNRAASYDFTFNAWGGKFEGSLDNAVNKTLFKRLGGELIKVPLELEGGSVDFNGEGTMLTTCECLLNANRGARSREELDARLRELFGLERIVWLSRGFIRGDDTDSHVDTLARFVAPNLVAHAACDDENDEHHAELKAMAGELKSAGLDLVPLPLPQEIKFENRRLGATYCNFIFINGALIVPTYGDRAADERALATLREAVPNRDIVGVDARVFIRQNGSLHCSSQNRFKAPR